MATTQTRYVRVNDTDMKIKLTAFVASLNPRVLLNVCWGIMQGSIARTFAEQGYPAGSWPKLSPRTIAARRNRNATSIQILRDTGILFNSIQPEFLTRRLNIGSALVYAGIHQHGGEAGRKPPYKKDDGRAAKVSRAVEAAKKMFGGKSHRARTALAKAVDRITKQHVPGHRAIIPARPFLLFRKDDPTRMAEAIDSLANKRIRELRLGKGGN